MFKFLRKYNKWILAVGGTLLMIVFLIPQAFTDLSSATGTNTATRATVGPDNRDVTFAEFQRVQQQVEVLGSLGLPIRGLGMIRDPWHWYLLTREASMAGLVGAPVGEEDRQFLETIGYTRTREETVQNWSSVTQMLMLYQTTGQLSDRRLRAEADRLFYSVQIQPVVIEASADAVEYEPTEAEIQAQLDGYAELDINDPENRFGYRLPNRVKIEWLAIPIDEVRKMVEGSGLLSGTELRKHWRLNASNPDFPPVPDPPPAEVPAVVREDLLTKLTDQSIDEIARFATSRVRAATRALPREEGYIALPDDWAQTRPSFEQLAQSIVERFHIELPEYHSVANRWLTEPELVELPGVGRATTDLYPPSQITLASLVRAMREFDGSPTILMQAGITGPPLTDTEGNLYVFRVTEADAARAPTSIDEVRDRVVTDLKRLKHYEALKAEQQRLEFEAERESMVALAVEHGTMVQSPVAVSLYDPMQLQFQTMAQQPLVPQPSRLPVIGAHEPTVEAIIDYARSLPADTDFEQLNEQQRIASVAVDDALAILIYRLVRKNPYTEEQLEQRVVSGELATIIINEELDPLVAIQEAFGYETMRERHNLQLVAPEVEEEDAEEEATLAGAS